MTTVTLIRVVGAMIGPWTVGAATADPTINVPVLIDPRTQGPVLPATTLVGALRAYLGANLAERWLGPPPISGAASQDGTRLPSTLWASPVTVDADRSDRRLTVSTAVDPIRGAAAGRSLRTEERTERPQGGHTRFDWTLEHPGPVDHDLLNHLLGWSTQIGRRQTTGYGSLAVTAVTAYTFDLNRADHLTWWLSDRASTIRQTRFSTDLPVPDTAIATTAATTGQGTANQVWRRDINWKVIDPLHIGDPQEIDTDDPAADRKATTRRVRRQPGASKHTGLPVMPGTGWKGIFRHRVEYILNTLGTDADTVATIIGVLFGHPGNAGPHPTSGRRGLLRFADSAIASGERGNPRSRVRTHVAIDRISGGARDGLLFTMEGIDTGRLTLTITASQPIPEPVDNLLRHVLMDLHEGLIGIGGSTTRGYGTIALTGAPVTAWAVDVTAITEWCRDIVNPQPRRRP